MAGLTRQRRRIVGAKLHRLAMALRVRPDTKLTQIIQEDGALAGHVALDVGAEFRQLEVDESGKFAVIRKHHNQKSAVVPINKEQYNKALTETGSVVREASQEHFPELSSDPARLDAYVKDVSARVLAALEIDPLKPGSWVQAVSQRGGDADQRRTVRDIPETAPAIWSVDKLPGDKPPDFIKRHYGPWLRSDAMGLARSDLRKLDKSLYTALAQWLHRSGETLPKDCPLPHKSDAVTAELQHVSENPRAESAYDYHRKTRRARYQLKTTTSRE